MPQPAKPWRRPCKRFVTTGRPGPRKERHAGVWSRRITEEHRSGYKVSGGELWIAQARYHYAK
ncbi:MAG: type II toxin-antitoxin system YoeB family toxin [Verrucomicrobiales bacterium]|nr:type II toxin-antitoxin system YoeB family toxin [Verrucomicrobiales bacterium]